MPDVTINAHPSFTAETGSSILDGATIAGIYLPYSCKTGRCGTCRCKLIAGKTTALQPETGLTKKEQATGWILSCVRTAETDITIAAESTCDMAMPAAITLPCKIHRIDTLASDLMRVFLRLPPSATFHYLPGQHVEIIGAHTLRRRYSLATASAQGNLIELHIRAMPEGAMSQYWFTQARENDLLHLNGPLGTFSLRDSRQIDLIFLATGTGIAPVKAMLETLSMAPIEHRPASLTVFWGNRLSKDFYLTADDLPGTTRYIPVLSQPGNDWHGARGHVQDVFLATHPDLTNTVVYACGSDAMIHDAKAALTHAGLPPGRFHSDAFVCSAPPSTIKDR